LINLAEFLVIQLGQHRRNFFQGQSSFNKNDLHGNSVTHAFFSSQSLDYIWKLCMQVMTLWNFESVPGLDLKAMHASDDFEISHRFTLSNYQSCIASAVYFPPFLCSFVY